MVGVAGERVRAESSLQLHTKQKGLLLKLASPQSGLVDLAWEVGKREGQSPEGGWK